VGYFTDIRMNTQTKTHTCSKTGKIEWYWIMIQVEQRTRKYLGVHENRSL
jgi:hypothetical protein